MVSFAPPLVTAPERDERENDWNSMSAREKKNHKNIHPSWYGWTSRQGTEGFRWLVNAGTWCAYINLEELPTGEAVHGTIHQAHDRDYQRERRSCVACRDKVMTNTRWYDVVRAMEADNKAPDHARSKKACFLVREWFASVTD